jgi:hypothetical protein
MRQILEAIKGPLCLNTYLLRPQECPQDCLCPAHSFWERPQINPRFLSRIERLCLLVNPCPGALPSYNCRQI